MNAMTGEMDITDLPVRSYLVKEIVDGKHIERTYFAHKQSFVGNGALLLEQFGGGQTVWAVKVFAPGCWHSFSAEVPTDAELELYGRWNRQQERSAQLKGALEMAGGKNAGRGGLLS